MLQRRGVDVRIVNCHTIKPIDEDSLVHICSITRNLITIEEFFTSGGLGTAILESISEKRLIIPIFRIGILKKFSKSGSYQYMHDFLELTPTSIFEKILSFVRKEH